ncbi:MAG: choice-of-anchor L domain-containing protein [Bacteroidota bacterium]|nr:choice-of-anchor L domain-containing protein [Bacteroidota bacterium]
MKKAILLLVVLCAIKAQSQIAMDNTAPYNTATYLINNILLGGGIAVTNHSFIGDSNQIGFFNGVNSNLGIDSGIVLSSGNIFDLVGPNANGSTTTSFLLPGDPTLDAVIFPDLTNDAAVLEFDFIPTSDTISFKYVFGSEEYLEWVNSFNDAFGFFLSGPNPTGGNYIDQNLAIIPGTTTPVTIDNVNNVVNATYYIDNGDGFTPPQSTDTTAIQFDGFTTPLTAVAAVNCGDTYHIKLVVADAVDNAYDSGVFLESGSFSSLEPGAISIQVNTTDAMCNGDSSGTASISCMQGVVPPYTINWNGQDPNFLLAGNYTVHITDANGIISTQFYVINEATDIVQNLSYNGVSLSSNASGGTPSYTYSWLFNNVIIGNTMNYSPIQNGDYICIVIDANGCTDTSDIINVNNLATGINELFNTSLVIYPNPFTTRTTIKLLDSNDVLNNISLFDYAGRKVKTMNVNSENNIITLEKGDLTKGIYMLFIQTDNFTSTSKLLIH